MLRYRFWSGLGLALSFVALAGFRPGAWSQEKSVKPGINDHFVKPDVAKFRQTFEGESREIYSQRQDILASCNVKPGMCVADIGAGTGLFTRIFAAKVGPKGQVYAVDIAPEFLAYIEESSRAAGLDNVKCVLGKTDSVELPPASVDLVFICDTYHHFEFPYRTLATIHRALRPGGQLVLVDFIRVPGKSREWVLGHVRAGQDVVTREVQDAGFKPVEEHRFLKENYLLRFERVERLPPPGPAADPARP